VRQLQGRLAIQRGPVVYCLEGVDHPEIENLDRISFTPQQVAEMSVEHMPDLLGGVTRLHGQANLVPADDWNASTLYRYNQPTQAQHVDVTAVPYCVWDNRDAGEMRVWYRSN
jgi:DUF1680 family protein